MPSDTRVVLPIGTGGLNLKSSAVELSIGELVDTLNWQLDQNGALIKRLGFQEWSNATPATILQLMKLEIAGGTTYVLAHCADGHVYSTTDGGIWTSIDSGISTTARVAWVQYLDKIYYSDGTSNVRQWDGTTLTTFAGIPKGAYFAIWRNRLWVAGVGATPRRVQWSKAGDPTDFATFSLNSVDFPDDQIVTAIATAPNIGIGSDGADGVLVFTHDAIHRITDDTDNVTGAVIGGANMLVDGAVGCISHRSVQQVAGRTWFLHVDGVYSTDGHTQARLESETLGPLFRNLNFGSAQDFTAKVYLGRYLLAITMVGQATNSRLLECNNDLPKTNGQYPWMAHDIPVRSWVRLNDASGENLYVADSRPLGSNSTFVRQAFIGGYDVENDSTQNDIFARARTGALLLGTSVPKRIRRIEMFGRGAVNMAVSADLSAAQGETQRFDMVITGRIWSLSDHWGSGVWGGGGGAKRTNRYYTTRGRYMTFEISETSDSVSSHDRALGYAGSEAGGAAAYSVVLKVTPLDAD